MPSRFCGVQNRSTLSMVVAGHRRSRLDAVLRVLPVVSTASLSGLVGSWVRSLMIYIPTAQIRATMAVGYRKITFGHMKIRMPCSRC